MPRGIAHSILSTTVNLNTSSEYLPDICYSANLKPHQADVSESSGEGGTNLIPEGNCLYRPYFFILKIKIISRDSRDTKAVPHRVHDQPSSFIGHHRVPQKRTL